MKKFLLSSALLLAALAARAQDDVDEGELNYIFDHETMTATVTQNRWWQDYGGGMGGQWHNTYEGDIVIPETVGGYTVVAIGEQAFANLNNDAKSISSISIPKTVKTIGERAFKGCYNLKSITLPATLESIGNMVFDGSAIETLTISDGDTPLAIGESGSVAGTCLGFTGLKTIYVGRDITLNDYCQEWIGRSTFANASTITDVTYGPKVTMIHPGEFFRNEAIERVTFLMDEIEIPDEAFHEAKGLTTVVLPERVTAIGEQAFRTVPSLTSLTLPPTINKIGTDAFNGCKAIKQLTIPATATSIGEYAFQYSSLEKLTISDSEEQLTMGWSCFGGMDNGQIELYIGRPLVILGRDNNPSNWDGVGALREITYGGSYSGMVAKEAYNCKGLQKVIISGPLVTEITLPASVTLLGKNSFGTDGPLSSIVCLGSTPPVCEGFPFYYTDKARNGEMKLYVPQGADTAYRNAEHWKEFYFISTEVPTGIDTATGNQHTPTYIWYTLDGRRLNEAPTHPGCYIYNGKKIMK